LNYEFKNAVHTRQIVKSCQGSVPEAIIAFPESSDLEDATEKGSRREEIVIPSPVLLAELPRHIIGAGNAVSGLRRRFSTAC